MSEQISPQPPPGDALQQVLSMAANLPILIEQIRPILNQNGEESRRAKELEEWFKSVVNVSGFSGRLDIHSESFRTQFESHIGRLEAREKELEEAKREVHELQMEVQRHNEKLRKLQEHYKRLSQEVITILDCDDDEPPSTSRGLRVAQTEVQEEVISSSKHSIPSPNTTLNLSEATNIQGGRKNPVVSAPDTQLSSISFNNLGNYEAATPVSTAASAAVVQAASPGQSSTVNDFVVQPQLTPELLVPVSITSLPAPPETNMEVVQSTSRTDEKTLSVIHTGTGIGGNSPGANTGTSENSQGVVETIMADASKNPGTHATLTSNIPGLTISATMAPDTPPMLTSNTPAVQITPTPALILPPMRLRIISNSTLHTVPPSRLRTRRIPTQTSEGSSATLSNAQLDSNNRYAWLRRDLTCSRGRCKGVKFPSFDSLTSHIKRAHHFVARKSTGSMHRPFKTTPAARKSIPATIPPRRITKSLGPSSQRRGRPTPGNIAPKSITTYKKSVKRQTSTSKLEQLIRNVSRGGQESSDDEQPQTSTDKSSAGAKRKHSVSFLLPEDHEDGESTEEIDDTSHVDTNVRNKKFLKWCKVCHHSFPDAEMEDHMKTHRKPATKKGSPSTRGKGGK